MKRVINTLIAGQKRTWGSSDINFDEKQWEPDISNPALRNINNPNIYPSISKRSGFNVYFLLISKRNDQLLFVYWETKSNMNCCRSERMEWGTEYTIQTNALIVRLSYVVYSIDTIFLKDAYQIVFYKSGKTTKVHIVAKNGIRLYNRENSRMRLLWSQVSQKRTSRCWWISGRPFHAFSTKVKCLNRNGASLWTIATEKPKVLVGRENQSDRYSAAAQTSAEKLCWNCWNGRSQV